MPSGIPTSSRRPRSSMGPLDVTGAEGISPQKVDLEFRRKHSRQNKEIIAENVQHKNSIKVLRDEITSLKEELLEVKHANRILAGRVDASRRAAPSAQASVGLAALDTLLEALPALQNLRSQLEPSHDDPPPIAYEVTRRNVLRNMGMSIATRPAASGSRLRGLGTLGEEDGLEPTGIEAYASVVQQSASSPFAKAASRSPIPLGLLKPPPPTFVVNSPASSASPSPKKRIVPSPKRKPKRRRESGLLPPPPVPSRGPTSPIQSPSRSANGVNDAGWTDVVNAIEAEDDQGSAGSGSEPGAATPEAPTSPDPTSSATGSSSSNDMSRSYNLSDLLSPSSAAAIAEEDGKRVRRARSSVNYKEPSLTKKMRKPDGVAVSDMLNHRRSLSHGITSEMALPRPGMRRKSVLPRSLGKLSDPASLDDEDEIEESLLVATRESSPLSVPSDTSSILSDPPSSSSSSKCGDTSILTDGSEIERIPTPIPPLQAERTSGRQPTIVEPVASKPAVPVPARTSPRKQTVSSHLKVRQPSTLVGRPRTSRVITPSSRAREALAAVSEPNMPPKAARTASQSSVMMGKQRLQ